MTEPYKSRSVFNEKAEGKAHQRKAREEAAERYEGNEWWEEADLDLGAARVRPTSRTVAEKIILEYEWLGTLPSTARRYYGIFFDGWACGGVCCFANGGAGINQARMFGVDRDELAYLIRGAVVHWAPPNTNSKLISYSLDHEKEAGKKVAVAYSDLDAGEIGTVYQATNWYCLGRGASLDLLIHPETGRPYNPKVVDAIRDRSGLDGWSYSAIKDLLLKRGWRIEKSKPKYRYAYILADGDEERRIYREIKDLITGYPKRERDAFPDGV